MIKTKVRDRIGFKEFTLEELPNNRCGGLVVLAWPDGGGFMGTAQAEDTETGRLSCAAAATARALEQAVNDEIVLDVLGVRTITESGIGITLALLSCRLLGEAHQLVGSCVIGDQPARSAVLAVLKATNRLLANVIFAEKRLSSS